MPTFFWKKCGGKLFLAIPGSEGHSSACAWKLGVYLQTLQIFQATPFSQNCTNSRSKRPQGVDDYRVARHGRSWASRPSRHWDSCPADANAAQSNQGRVSPSDELTSAKQDVELAQSHMDVTLSVWRDSELVS